MTDLLKIPVRAADGVESKMLAWQDDGLSPSAPVLLMKPALGVRASFYSPLFEPFAEAGMRVVTADLRGHGRSSARPGRRCNFGYREMIELDLPAETEAVKAAFPGAPLILMGHSLGGQASLLYAATHPGAVDGVAAIATCSVYWKSFPRGQRLSLLAITQATAWLGRLVGHFPGDRVGFGGREARGVMRDWAHQARTGRYEPAGSDVDYEAALSKSATPALIATLPNDGYAPPSAADHLAGKLPSQVVTRVDLDKPLVSKAHFRWVKDAEAVVAVVGAWLAEQGIGTASANRSCPPDPIAGRSR